MSATKSPPESGMDPKGARDGQVYDPDLAPAQPRIDRADRPDIQQLLALMAEDPLNDAPPAEPLVPQPNGVLATKGDEAASAYVAPTALPAPQPLEIVAKAKVQLGGRGGSRTAMTERIRRGGEGAAEGAAEGLGTSLGAEGSPWQVNGAGRIDKALLPSAAMPGMPAAVAQGAAPEPRSAARPDPGPRFGVRLALILVGLFAVIAGVGLWVLWPKLSGSTPEPDRQATQEGTAAPQVEGTLGAPAMAAQGVTPSSTATGAEAGEPPTSPAAPKPTITAPPVTTGGPNAPPPSTSLPTKAPSFPTEPSKAPGAAEDPTPSPPSVETAAPTVTGAPTMTAAPPVLPLVAPTTSSAPPNPAPAKTAKPLPPELVQ
jgi:hypothetical protein